MSATLGCIGCSPIKFVLLSLVLYLSILPSDSTTFQDLPYKELNVRSYSLKSPFAIVASAKELYDLKEARQVKKLILPQYSDYLITEILRSQLA